ncbi:ArsR/SmtB family transcription factor [Ottowia sp.]|uniref:ArsR/SmtB family transcription factor n=1 Tax=Ottowia sp. TaxID=1898956 RepID=UPI003A8BABCD
MTHATATPTDTPVVFDPKSMRHGAHAAVTLLKLLGNEDRLMILCQLSQGECAVGELEQCLGIRQPTLSQQLAVLRSQNVVSTRREGKNVVYAIAQTEVLRLLQTLHELFCQETPA